VANTCRLVLKTVEDVDIIIAVLQILRVDPVTSVLVLL